MVLAKDPWHSSVVYVDAETFDIRFECDQQVPSIPVIAHELRCVCIPVNRSMSVSFFAEFHFTAAFINLYLFISVYKQNIEIMNSNKEMYVVLNFTIVCHIILLLLAVLQCCVLKRSCLFGVSKDVKRQYYWPFCVGLHLWSIYQECLYQRCVTSDTAHGLMR